jgi:hypothetical protein
MEPTSRKRLRRVIEQRSSRSPHPDKDDRRQDVLASARSGTSLSAVRRPDGGTAHGTSHDPYRALGRHRRRNPLCVVLPCHRVVASSGALTGYSGGLAAKEYLLALESSH